MVIEKQRFWLSLAPLIHFQPLPLIYELCTHFALRVEVRNSSFGEDLGVIGVEFEGDSDTIYRAVEWLESLGVTVEPVELSVIES